MSDILKTLRESDSLLLKAEGADLAKWSKLKHIKEDFELFLQFNIAEIEFTTLNGKDTSAICTSNAALIKILQAKELKDKQKFVKLKGSGIHIKNKNAVMSWDLVEDKYKTIPLNSWQIVNFISITPDNVLILDELINKLIKS